MKRYSVVIFIYCLIFWPFLSSKGQINALKTACQQIDTSGVFKYGYLGLSVWEFENGKEVFVNNGKKSLVPASNLKLITTAAALGIVGENYRFKTILGYTGQLKDSLLNGNILIIGSGDPTFGSDRFAGYLSWREIINQWVGLIQKAGIKKINGTVQVDVSALEACSVPDFWPWGDLGNYYGAGLYGFNFNENKYSIYFKGKTQGDIAEIVKAEPSMYGIEYLNSIRVGPSGSGDQAYLYAGENSNKVYMKGTIPANTSMFEVKGALINPPFQFAQFFKDALINKGINVSEKPIVRATKEHYTLLTNYSSPPLKDIVAQTNLYSVNLFAEGLLKLCGLKTYGVADTESGIKAVKAYWSSKGVDVEGWFMFDGSGMSPNNALPVSTFSQVLYLIGKDSIYTSFFNSLPVAGKTGTVYRVGKGTNVEGNFFMKSGSMSKVMNYSGYFKSASGKKYCFALMANNYSGSNAVVLKKIEKILLLLYDLP